jgi:3-deoxy-D-arabino-heptulosonate 7-phosphate (DAHP) synthase class II
LKRVIALRSGGHQNAVVAREKTNFVFSGAGHYIWTGKRSKRQYVQKGINFEKSIKNSVLTLI